METQVDERMVELLTETGLNRNIAKVVAFLAKVGEAVSRDIERAANLRQPEVSLAMKELKELGWVKERELKKKGKGRPLKSYKLTRELKEIVAELVTKKKEEIKKIEKDLEELESIAGLR
ncbi:MAG: ArsR family transcriptional regulator [Archaeoglobaceae archaeon]|nr:ArsR family transcriptional regulator [Archaeoglobaceae archaeon]MCX8152603.1 ArsR family transcriptional regulator [Archaeoglobaceae archaeon]MDW8014115.1 ArsR family transcriptional regulator [Archaeoglobaceae archaeon]